MTNLRSENVADTIELYGNERYPVGYTCKAGLGVAASLEQASCVTGSAGRQEARGARGRPVADK